MSKRKFVIDIDSVLTQTETVIHRILQAETGKDVPITDWFQYELGGVYGITDHQVYEAFLKHEHDMFMGVQTYPGARAFLERLREEDEVHIVTARGWSPLGESLTKRYFLQHELPYDSLTVIASSKLKGPFVKEIGAYAAKDDHQDHLYSMLREQPTMKACLRDQPWNAHVTDLIRVYSFEDFLREVNLSVESSPSMT